MILSSSWLRPCLSCCCQRALHFPADRFPLQQCSGHHCEPLLPVPCPAAGQNPASTSQGEAAAAAAAGGYACTARCVVICQQQLVNAVHIRLTHHAKKHCSHGTVWFAWCRMGLLLKQPNGVATSARQQQALLYAGCKLQQATKLHVHCWFAAVFAILVGMLPRWQRRCYIQLCLCVMLQPPATARFLMHAAKAGAHCPAGHSSSQQQQQQPAALLVVALAGSLAAAEL